MRIVAGKHRSIRLEVPKSETRPTSDRLKESMFNAAFALTSDQVWLDLFAGSGAIGCEALSRGAKHVVFNDQSKEAVECITRNLNKLHESERATVLNLDAKQAIAYCQSKDVVVDVVFCDPPYALDVEDVLMMLCESQVIATGGLLVVEQAFDAREYQRLANYRKIKERKVGKSVYRIYQIGEER